MGGGTAAAAQGFRRSTVLATGEGAGGEVIVCRKPYVVEGLRAAFPDARIVDAFDAPGADVARTVIAEPSELVADNLDQLPRLRLALCSRAGYDAADLAYLKERGVMLCNARGLYSIPIAEDIVCKILMGTTNAWRYAAQKIEHVYRVAPERRCLSSMTVGFAGVGSIACEAAMRLRPFGCRVVGWRRSVRPTPDGFDAVYVGEDGWRALLNEADVLVLAVDLNPGTAGLLDADAIALMRDGAMVVNIARGGVVDEAALIEALHAGKLAYAGLDVFETEPLPTDSPLWNLPNVAISPHASGVCTENHTRFEAMTIDNLRSFFCGSKLVNRVL